MLPLFTRRVTLSAYCSTATYTRILPSSASNVRYRRILGNSLRTSTAQSFANPQRNASTEVTVTTNKAKTSNKSATIGRKKPGEKPTPGQKAAREEFLWAKTERGKELERKKKTDKVAALRAKTKAQAERKKEKERQKAREAKELKLIKPPPRRMSPISLFVHEAKKPLLECHADWRNFSEEQKQEYVVRAKATAEERKRDFDAFVKSITPLDVKRYNRHRRSMGKRAIHIKFDINSRPLSSFLRYVQEFRTQPDQAGKPPMEVAKAAGELWRSLTQEEKDKYKAAPSESATV